MEVFRKSYKRVREHAKGDPVAYPFCPKGAHTLNFHCSVQSNFKCLKQKALLPSGGYCKISQIIFAFYMTASSFVIVHLVFFVFSWYSTVPPDIPLPNSNFFFLKAFFPLCCLLSRKELSYPWRLYFILLCRICICQQEWSTVLLDLTRINERRASAAILQEKYKLAKVLIKQGLECSHPHFQSFQVPILANCSC